MLAKERRLLLVTELNRTGKLVTSEIASQLGVSDVTIRADFDHLERQGRLTRTHGGAIPADASAAVVAFDLRLGMRAEAKRSIALRAAEFIGSDQTIILDAGTTTHHLAQVIPEVSNLTVYTPGISLAQQLLGVDGVEVHLFGGRVDSVWLQTVGPPLAQGIKGLLAHTVFLGAYGIDDDLDIVDQSSAMAKVKQQYVRRARRVVLLADSSKIGRTGKTKVMAIDRVDILITDDEISPADRKRLAERDIELIIADHT